MSTQENRGRMLKIVDDTVEYYSEDVSRRASFSGLCSYRITTEDGRVKKCALGRYIRDEAYQPAMEGLACDLPDKCQMLGTTFDDILTPEAQGLSVEFWIDLQGLHDDSNHWTETGISDQGMVSVGEIKDSIERGEYDI